LYDKGIPSDVGQWPFGNNSAMQTAGMKEFMQKERTKQKMQGNNCHLYFVNVCKILL
jgi:hypothetical protein